MLFHPVDIQKKFGFVYPVGLFIDKVGAELIRLAMNKEDYGHFYDYSLTTQTYKDLMAFYNSQADMTESEIKATWSNELDGEFESFTIGHCKQITKLRAIGEALALGQREEPSPSIDKLIENLSFDNWREFYKKLR